MRAADFERIATVVALIQRIRCFEGIAAAHRRQWGKLLEQRGRKIVGQRPHGPLRRVACHRIGRGAEDCRHRRLAALGRRRLDRFGRLVGRQRPHRTHRLGVRGQGLRIGQRDVPQRRIARQRRIVGANQTLRGL